MSREAMQLALEALEDANDVARMEFGDEDYHSEAINALRQALSEQSSHQEVDWEKLYRLEVKKKEALAAKYERDIKPLTKIVPMAEPALRQALEIEPEALRLADALDAEFVQGRISNSTGRESAVELRRLALKQWVGLTDEEIQDLGYLSEKFDASNSEWFDRWGFARAIEAKLKEKNT
jgi:predicted nucleic acid-binding protein